MNKINSTSREKAFIVGFFCVLLLFLILLPTTHAHAIEMKSISSLLKDSNTAKSLGNTIHNAWQIVMNLANAGVIILLIAVAFAQILRLNVNTYGVKKVLPSLVLAIVAANFSWLFCRLMVDFVNVIISLFLEGHPSNIAGLYATFDANSPNGSAGTAGTFGALSPKPANAGGNIFWFLVAQLLIIAGGIVVYILAYLFIIRNWVILFLIPLAPLAFIAMAIPQTKSLFNQWWSNFSKWVFMPVVSVFWLWLGGMWFGLVDNSVYLLKFVFAGACFYLAITTPFKMGGAIMTQWGNLGKKAWGKTGGAAVGYAGNQAKWLAGGGIASTMALRNQLKAKQLKAEGKGDEAKKYDAKANRWTWVNPQAIKGGIKGRIEGRRGAIEGAPKKTAFYNRLLGSGATIRAGVEANKADFGVMSPEQVGSTVKDLLNDPSSGMWSRLPSGIRDRFIRESTNPANQEEMRRLGYTPAQQAQYAQHRFLQFLAKENADALGNEIKLGSGEYFNLGNLQAGAQEYMRMSRSNPAVRDRAVGSFVAISPVGRGGPAGSNVPGGAGQAISLPDAMQVILAGVSDDAAQKINEARTILGDQMSEAAINGEDFDTGVLEGKGEPEQKQIREAFDLLRGGAMNAVSKGVNSDAAAKIAAAEAVLGKDNLNLNVMTEAVFKGEGFEDFIKRIGYGQKSSDEQLKIKEAFEALSEGRETLGNAGFGAGRGTIGTGRHEEGALDNIVPPEVKSKLAGIIGKESTEKLVATASHYKTTFDEFLQELKTAGTNTDQLDEGAKAILKQSFEGIRAGKDKLVEDMMATSEEEIEEKMVGIREAFDCFKNAGSLGDMQKRIEEAQRLVGAKDFEGAKKYINEEVLPAGFAKLADTFTPEQITNRVNNLVRGSAIIGKKLSAEDVPEDKRQGRQAEMRRMMINDKLNNDNNFTEEIGHNLKTDARRSAETIVATRVALSNAATKPEVAGLTVGQFMGSPHFDHAVEELTHAVNGLAEHTGGGGEIAHAALGLDTEAVAERGVMADAGKAIKESLIDGLNTVLKNPNNNPNMSARSALASPGVEAEVYRAMVKANVLATRMAQAGPGMKVKVMNPAPNQKVVVENKTNPNVGNVGGNPTATAPTNPKTSDSFKLPPRGGGAGGLQL